MKYLLILITLSIIGCVTEPKECEPEKCETVRRVREWCFIPMVSERDELEVVCGFAHYVSCFAAGENRGVCEEQFEDVEVCE